MDRHPISLHTLCQQALSEVRAAWPDADLRMTSAPAPNVLADPDRIAQVLVNLLGNAVQHGEPGHAITLSLDSDGSHARIAVSNRGELPPQARDGLFAPFHPGARNSEGLGLGLYIVEQFVRAHDGSVHAHSEQGATTFEMLLPLADDAAT
jgi:two-component system, sensor histidine kinase and response regulator